MPAHGELYVFGPGGEDGGDSGWVSPRPVEEVVIEVVTDATDLSADDIDALEDYADRTALADHLDGEPADDPLTFDVEGHEVSVAPDGTVAVADE
jgi:hypothetical protein